MLRPKPIGPEEGEQGEQEDELEQLSEAEFEKLSPEEKLLRAIFGQAPAGKRGAKRNPPPPVDPASKLTAQSQPERMTMRFSFEQPLMPADLARRVVPALEAVSRLDQALANAMGTASSDTIQIQRVAYGSPLDVQLAPVNPPTVAVLHALAQNQDLSAAEQARLKELHFRLLEAQVERAARESRTNP